MLGIASRSLLALCCTLLLAAPASAFIPEEVCEATGVNKLAVRRDNVYTNVIRARTELASYDLMLEAYASLGTVDDSVTRLNEQRGEILKSAVSAYFFGGDKDYPVGNADMLPFLNSLTMDDMTVLRAPDSLDVLVETGILPHLPASPYEGGQYLSDWPEEAQPGDVYYEPIAVFDNYLRLEPGDHEANLLIIFDREHDSNESLLSFAQLDEQFPGELAKFIDPESYGGTACFIFGSDPDSW